MKRTWLGLIAMTISLLLGTVITLGSFISLRGKLDSAALTSQPLSVPTLLVSCLDPLAILLEIIAILLVAMDSRQVGKTHRRLAWGAALLFVIWGIVNLGVFLPLSFIAMQRGSLSIFKAGQTIKAVAALLQYTIPFLLVFGLSRKWTRRLLCMALALTMAGNFGVVVLPIASMQLTATQIYGQMTYMPHINVDYTAGLYPLLLALGYLGGALYLLAYGLLTWQMGKPSLAQYQKALPA